MTHKYLVEVKTTAEPPKGQDSKVQETVQPASNHLIPQVSVNNSNGSNEEIASKAVLHPTSQETTVCRPEVNNSNTQGEKPTEVENNNCKTVLTCILPKIDNETNKLQSIGKETVENSVTTMQNNATASISASATVSNKSDSENSNQEYDVILEEERMSVNGDDFQTWLSQKKETWKFEERVKKASSSCRKSNFESAASFGLPDGWMVRIKDRSRYTFRCPNGKHFYSKKKACEYLGITTDELRARAGALPVRKNNGTDELRARADPLPGENNSSIAFTRVYPSTTEEKKNVLKENPQQKSEKEKSRPISSQSDNLPNHLLSKDTSSLTTGVLSKNIPSSELSVGNDRSRALISAKSSPEVKSSIKEQQQQQQQSDNSDSSVDSVSDVITKLNDSRRIVAQFGPLPWKGCKIVKVPPAPQPIGLNIVSVPRKFGTGIVRVHDTSPLYGQVKTGDTITHFMNLMSMPLHGLKADEVVRLLQSEVQNDRLLHIAPGDFDFDQLFSENTNESQTCKMNTVMRESEQKLKIQSTNSKTLSPATTKIVAVNTTETTSTSANKNYEVGGDTSDSTFIHTANIVKNNRENNKNSSPEEGSLMTFETGEKNTFNEKKQEQSVNNTLTLMNSSNQSKYLNAQSRTIPESSTFDNTSTTSTHGNSSLVDDAVDVSPLMCTTDPEKNMKSNNVVKCANKVDKEALNDVNIPRATEAASPISQRNLPTWNKRTEEETVNNNLDNSNFLRNNEPVTNLSRTRIKLEETDEVTIASNENISGEKVENYLNNSTRTERIENRENSSTQRIENLCTKSASEETSSDARTQAIWTLMEVSFE